MTSRPALVYRLNLSKKSDHKRKIKSKIHKRDEYSRPSISNMCDVFLSNEVDFILYIIVCPDCNQLHYGNIEFKTKPLAQGAYSIQCSAYSYRNCYDMDKKNKPRYVTNDLIACANNGTTCEIRLFETLQPDKSEYLIDSNHPIFYDSKYNICHMAVLYELNMLSEYAVVSNLSIHLIPDLFIVDIIDTEILLLLTILNDAQENNESIYSTFTYDKLHKPWPSLFQEYAKSCNDYTTNSTRFTYDTDIIDFYNMDLGDVRIRDRLLLFSYKRSDSNTIEYGGIKDYSAIEGSDAENFYGEV